MKVAGENSCVRDKVCCLWDDFVIQRMAKYMWIFNCLLSIRHKRIDEFGKLDATSSIEIAAQSRVNQLFFTKAFIWLN